MKRRNLLATLGALVGGVGTIGTGAFTSVSAERTVSVSTATDDDAFLALEPANTVYGSKYAEPTSDGLLELSFGDNGRGSGLGTDSEYNFDDVFTITNQGTQPVYVWGTFDFADSDFEEGSVWFYPNGDSTTEMNDGGNAVVKLQVGETVYVGVHFDTTNVDLGEATLTATINAAATKPGDSTASDPGGSPSAPVSPYRLQGYYPLDGDADDNNVEDASGNERDGISVGDVTFEETKDRQAATFDDSDDQHIELADGSTFGYDTFTVATWAKVNSGADHLQTILARQSEDGKHTERTFILWFDHDNAHFGAELVASRLSETDGDLRTIEADDESYTDGEWHHVAMTVDGGTEIELYVDGDSKGTQTLDDDPYTGDAKTWVGNEPGRNRPLNGSVDEVRIYDRILAPSEIDSLATES